MISSRSFIGVARTYSYPPIIELDFIDKSMMVLIYFPFKFLLTIAFSNVNQTLLIIGATSRNVVRRFTVNV